MKLIVGLGNPARQYKNSRHNIGTSVVNRLAKEYKIKFIKDKSRLFKYAKATTVTGDFILAYPLVFMNLSGRSLAYLVKKFKIHLKDILVVCDDLDLDLGRVRIKPAGSSSGHRGLEDIIGHLKSNAFARLRIGIGRPANKEEIKDFVLSRFKPNEHGLITTALDRAVRCSTAWLREGIEEAMNQFNTRKKNEKI